MRLSNSPPLELKHRSLCHELLILATLCLLARPVFTPGWRAWLRFDSFSSPFENRRGGGGVGGGKNRPYRRTDGLAQIGFSFKPLVGGRIFSLERS